MLSKAKVSAVFNRRKKDTKGDVEIYIYFNGQKKYYRTGITIDVKLWSQKKNCVTDKHENADYLNYHINDIVNKADAYQLKILQTRELTIDDFDFHFRSKVKQNDFITFCTQYTSQDLSVTHSTTKNRNQFISHLKNCFTTLPYNRINHETVEQFDNYLRSQGHAGGTINKHHNRFKKFITEAINRNLLHQSPYNTFRVKRPANNIKNILWHQELKDMEKLSFTGTMELSRLKFLFCCYTGLRVSDATALTWGQIRNNKIFISTIKTNRPAVIPLDLFPGTQKILLRLKQLHTGNTVFPYIADTVYNRNIKSIAIQAGIPFPVTSHVARHTFCTMIASITQSPFKVMEYTGITKIDTAMIYINLQKLYT